MYLSLKECQWEVKQPDCRGFTNSSVWNMMILGYKWELYQRKRSSSYPGTRQRLAHIMRSIKPIMRNNLTMLLSLRHRLMLNNS